MNNLSIFENPAFGQVRTTTINNEPWFVGKDVATALGYSNASKAVMMHVDDDDKRFEMMNVSDSQNGNLVKTALINESGLYSLILSSKLPTAKDFKRWVTSAVLPSIRKHGAYMTPATIEKVLSDPDTIIKLATQLKDEQAARRKLEGKVEQDRPKVLFADAVSASKNSILIGELAKILRQNGVLTGQKRLFQRLRNDGYLMKSGESYNLPTQRAMEMGLFEIKKNSITHSDGHVTVTKTTKVTGKGQIYFINRYKGGVDHGKGQEPGRAGRKQ